MNDSSSQQPPSTIGLEDALFTIFRHKWKILVFTLLGIGSAAAILWVTKPEFTSTAKLLVRYVTESRGPDAAGQGDVVREPDQRGAAIISSEVEILTSSDSIVNAAREVAPSRILAAYGGGTNEADAVKLLSKRLRVDAAKNSTVIAVSLSHRDPEIAQSALRALKEQYLDRHARIHRAADAFRFLQTQTDEIRGRLTQFETELQKRKNDLNVTSIEDAKKELITQLSQLRKMVHEAEADLAQHEAQLAPVNVNDAAGTNAIAGPGNPPAQALGLEASATHRRLSEQLERLKVQELGLRTTYADESTILKRTRQEIASVEKSIRDLGFDPFLVLAGSQSSLPPGSPLVQSTADVHRVVRSLKAKIIAMKAQEERLNEDVKKINNAEGVIIAMERNKTLTEDLYLYFSKNLERARIDQSLSEGRRNNISVIQEPTFGSPASKDAIKQAGIAFGGLTGFGLALAFVLDFLFNPAFKRRKEVESLLRLPVFASVPDFGRNGHSKLRLRPAIATSADAGALVKGQAAEILPWDEQDPMLHYYEAIRDRLVMSFDDDLHKPKIVGLTSSHHGAGVTRLATGVAAALSRDVQRNVLLIALAKNSVGLSAFSKGRPAVEFQEPTQTSGQQAAKGQDVSSGVTGDLFVAQNLHSLATTGRNLAGASVVQSFCDLIPKLKVADYDYIIFDLPPLSETSGSIRLASQMERTLFVVEADKSSKEQMKRARALLAGSKTKMAAVFNRARQVGPRFFASDV